MRTLRLLCVTLLCGVALPAFAQTPDAGVPPAATPPPTTAPGTAEPLEEDAAEPELAEPELAEPAPAPAPVAAPPPAPAPAPSRVEPVAAPYEDPSEDPDVSGDAAAERTLSTTAEAPPTSFAIWSDGESFIKPVLQMSALMVGYVPHSDTTDTLASRVSTLALARFGFEGRLFGFLTFRSVFERNMGYSLARNGPVGTSVWEGTASLQARENYLRIDKWGLALTGGIFPDPASIDFVSANMLDSFGMDPYVRDPLLVSGFGQGQGVMLRYRWEFLDFGLSYTGGNPLTTSLAFGFGGDVSSLGTLFSAPLRALANGIPGSDIHLQTLTPSATLNLGFLQVRTAAQLYYVDIDVTSDDDERLKGYNLRATAKVSLLDGMVEVFGGFAYRRNQQLAIPDVTTLRDQDYEGLVGSVGADFKYGAFGFGGMYYRIQSTISETSEFTNQYINVGVTYWLQEPNVSVGLRWARSMAEQTPNEPRLKATDSFILSMRLLL
ncbi:MAG: hypothetical protein CMN30_20545 [Sandaracinus sp.]|nr:hypothetical protein [Sandaracinus sp.]